MTFKSFQVPGNSRSFITWNCCPHFVFGRFELAFIHPGAVKCLLKEKANTCYWGEPVFTGFADRLAGPPVIPPGLSA